jgi:ubiquitin-conjugating enzyme E2 S
LCVSTDSAEFFNTPNKKKSSPLPLPIPPPPPLPSSPLTGLFVTKIFHPNVSPAGEICVNTLKKDWSPEHTLAHVLQVIHCLLIVPFPESALNDEAGKLFMESYDDYAKKARLMTNIHAGGPAMVMTSSAAGAAASSTSSSTAASSAAPAALSAGKGNLDLSAAATTSTSAVEKRKANGEVEPTKDAAAKKKSLKRL